MVGADSVSLSIVCLFFVGIHDPAVHLLLYIADVHYVVLVDISNAGSILSIAVRVADAHLGIDGGNEEPKIYRCR